MGGRAARRRRERRHRETAERVRRQRRERRAAAVLAAIAVAATVATAVPSYRYVRADTVDAELVRCDRPRGRTVGCTARWSLAGGRLCEGRVRADTRHWRRWGRDYVRVDGCEVRDERPIGVFAAFLFIFALTGVIMTVRRVRDRRRGT